MDSNYRPLRIAQIATLWEQIPPKGYGGIEMIISSLTDGLRQRGHEVTLFAPEDTQSLASVVPVCSVAIRHDPTAQKLSIWDQFRKHQALEIKQLKEVYARSDQFDVIHSHLEVSALSFASQVDTPTLHTLHMEITPDSAPLYRHYEKQGLVSISDAQREVYPDLNYLDTVYNAIHLQQYTFHPHPQDPPYLAFLGRLSREKGIYEAIQIARVAGMPLKIAGKIGKENEAFYQQQIKPLIDGEQIQYLGEVSHHEKVELLGNAVATLFPITWREPFGLVMIESMACGTPVLGLKRGSVPEVISHGKTGFIAQDIEDLTRLIPAAMKLDRLSCHRYVESHFGIKQMVDGYEAAYQKLMSG